MNNKLKVALKCRSTEQGFAIPIAMGMGLVMLLITATMIVRSQGDQVTASTQKATNRSLSAAEKGIARYQWLINNNRTIATYNDCVTRNASGTCTDTGTTISWGNAAAIPGINSCSGGGGATPVANNSTITWKNVDSSDSSRGQYRLVRYVYSPAVGVSVGAAPGTGQLTVEGRVNQVGSGSTATKGLGTATTRLQVNIPVQQGNAATIPVPGLWFKSGTLGPHVGNGNEVNGNLLFGGCDVNSVGGTVNGTRTAAPELDFPTLTTPPTSPAPINLGSITSSKTLPTRNVAGVIVDTPVIKEINGYKVEVYEYKVTSIELGGGGGGGTLTITPGKRVTLYVEENINTGGSSGITHNCTGYTRPGPLTPISTTSIFPIPTGTNPKNEDCKASNLQILGYGKTNLTGADISNPEICLNGNGFLQAMILAPRYKAGVAGAGASGGFKGSIWVNEWSTGSGCGSNTSNVVVDQTTTWDELVPLGLIPKNIPPTISSVSSWQRREAP
jgi:Tfp pilus assembly protein PilX